MTPVKVSFGSKGVMTHRVRTTALRPGQPIPENGVSVWKLAGRESKTKAGICPGSRL